VKTVQELLWNSRITLEVYTQVVISPWGCRQPSSQMACSSWGYKLRSSTFMRSSTALSLGFTEEDSISRAIKKYFKLEWGLLLGTSLLLLSVILGLFTIHELLAIAKPHAQVNIPVTELSAICILRFLLGFKSSFRLSIWGCSISSRRWSDLLIFSLRHRAIFTCSNSQASHIE